MRAVPLLLVGVVGLLVTAMVRHDGTAVDPYPTVHANDNRLPAGVLVDGVLHVDLEVTEGRWYPESVDGPSVTVAAIGEVGKGPEIPAPLLRVTEGTPIQIRLANTLDTALMAAAMSQAGEVELARELMQEEEEEEQDERRID